MKVRKKAVVVEAVEWEGGAEAASPIIDWVLSEGGTATWTEAYGAYEGPDGSYPAESECIRINTLEGVIRASPGDWIIRGVKDEFYPCKPDIFWMTYEFPEEDDFWDKADLWLGRIAPWVFVAGLTVATVTLAIASLRMVF